MASLTSPLAMWLPRYRHRVVPRRLTPPHPVGDNPRVTSHPRPPSRRQAIDGVLLVNKPAGITSTQAVGWAKRLFNAAKAGHTGTLDPFATGLLPICFGEATKFSADLLDADKTYLATMRLGVRSTTGDTEGEVAETQPFTGNEADIARIMAQFVGEIDQVPPMYSALKRDGKPLYEYARQGIELDRAARRVTIHALALRSMPAPDQAVFEVTCSKGTYVRTLAEAIGKALGTVAHLTALQRTRIASAHTVLTLENAHGLDNLEALPFENRMERLFPADALVNALPMRVLEDWQVEKFRHGQSVAVPAPAPLERIYGPHAAVNPSAQAVGANADVNASNEAPKGMFHGLAQCVREANGTQWGAIRAQRLMVFGSTAR
jgi:tRNA pseudouridine55 synthase